jgi:UDP-glucose:(heptosyl)LPS alpha-1,3-glucosyltransferase
LKIAFVVHDYYLGAGHSRYVVELATRFAAEHEVHIFANRFDLDPLPGMIFHQVPAWRFTAITSILSFFFCSVFAIQGKFDVIHSQGLCTPRFCNVLTAHVCGDAWYAARRRFNRLSFKDYIFSNWVNTLERWLFRYSKSSSVIAISRRVQDDLIRWYQCRSDISVIYHGVDIDHFRPAKYIPCLPALRTRLERQTGNFIALYIGDLRKGGECAIRAVAECASVTLVCVSRSRPGPYRALTEELGIADRVCLEPASSNVDHYYAAADCFLFPTSYDAFGMVISEAMAMGLPVITTTEAGAAEWIEEGVSGLLVAKPDDHSTFARHIRMLRSDKQLCTRISRAARAVAEEHAWDAVAAATLNVYQTAASF